MLVDVIPLRHLGVKLEPADIRATQAVRGQLRLSNSRVGWYPGIKNPPLMALLLSEGEPVQMLAPLDHCRVTKIDRGSLLIVGMQQYERPIRDFRNLPQVWWVRPVVQPRTVPLHKQS